MADGVRNDQSRSISTNSDQLKKSKKQKTTRSTKQKLPTSSQEASQPQPKKSKSSPVKVASKDNTKAQTRRSKSKETLGKGKKSKQTESKRGKQIASATLDEDIPGPSGFRKELEENRETQELPDTTKTSSKATGGKQTRGKAKKTPGNKPRRSVSETTLPTTQEKKQTPLKKTKSETAVPTISTNNPPRKRKSKEYTFYSPKKLRSSTHVASVSSPSKDTTSNNPVKKSAKTGAHFSRTRNPPEVSEPTGSDTSDKLGSCASRRRNRRGRSQLQDAPSAMDSERNGNSSAQDNTTTTNEDAGESTTGTQLTGGVAGALGATTASTSSSVNNDGELGASLEEGDMTRLQALLEARGLPAHLFGSLGPRMHLLLHKTFNSGAGAKAQQLLTSMQSEDEGTQLQGVMEMCQLLVMGNEETLSGFPVKQVVPVLITLLQMEHNFDIMNHACRALTYLMEGLPRSSVVVIDAVPMLLEKLQTIQCMDVAEQSLTALEMLSKRHGKNILQAGGLGASLLFLDFFSIVAQRSALAITANCCHSVTVEDFNYVRNSIQILSTRLLNQDKKSLESVCLAFARLVDNVQKDKKLLEELCGHELLANLKQLLIISPPLVSSGTFVMVIRMLGIMCANCPSIAVRLLNLNITETLRYILIGSNDVPTDEIVDLVPRSPQELYELITLICELLPNLPTTGIFTIDFYLRKGANHNQQFGNWQWKDDKNTWHSYMWVDNRIIEAAYQGGEDEISLSTLGRNYIIDFTNMQQINEDTGTIRSIQRRSGSGSSSVTPPKPTEGKLVDERAVIFQENEAIGKDIVQSLIAVVFDVYYSSVGSYVKHKCLNSILKMLHHSPSQLLKEVLAKIPISSYIAGMLSSQDHRIVCSALQKSDILMDKLSETFHVYFRREGVMHRVKKLADGDLYGSRKCSPNSKSSPSSKCSPPNVSGRSMSLEESSKHAVAVGISKRYSSIEHSSKGYTDVGTSLQDTSEVSSTSKLSSLRNRKKGLKKFTRSKSSKSMEEDSPTSKRLSHESSMRPKSANFSLSNHSTSAGNVASKASFFASFTPRWGRSQSFQSSTVPSPTEKGLKESMMKEQEQNKERIREWIKNTAQEFFDKYFAEQSGTSHPALNILLKLTSAAEELNLKGETDRRALERISEGLLTEDLQDGASPFEMVQSGMVTSLLTYLTCKGSNGETSRVARIRNFLAVFLGLPNINDSNSNSQLKPSTKPALVCLVQKLNLCINQLEQFPVKCQDIPGSGMAGGSRGSSALRFFNTHQIKCNLQRHPDCSSVKQWSGGAVKIDPLALVQAIERYLVVRGYGRIRDELDSEMSDDEDRSDDEIEESWASQLQLTNNSKHILEFTMNGHILPYNMTVYQAVRQYAKANHDDDSEIDDDSGPFGRASIWSGTHIIHYRPVLQPSEVAQPTFSKREKSDSQVSSSSSKSTSPSKINISTDISKQTDSSSFLTNVLPGEFASNDPSVEVICLLRVLYYLNSNWRKYFDIQTSHPVVSFFEFVNTKLTAKATRQLQDPLVIMTGNLPSWLAELAKACPFIFPFECRQLLFYTTTFDRDRAVMKLQETVPDLASTDSSDRVAPRLDKKKRTVSRNDLLKQAENIFNEFTSSRSLLEIQYEGEVGTGLGPTLEFYSLVSKEFQKAELELWRGDHVEVVEGDSKKNSKYYFSRNGLFPAVVHKGTKSAQLSKLKSRFRFMGKFMAKACMDSRMIDISFSETLYKWLLTPNYNFDISDMQHVDTTLYKSLSQLYDVVLQKKRIENDSSHTRDSLDLALSVLTLDGVLIDDLGLDFVLPGTTQELKRGGRDIPVDIYNLEEYLQLVIQSSLIDGVSQQLQAFKEGFQQYFPLSSLQMFYPHEIDLLLCGSKTEKWEEKDLVDCCRADHGYTLDSRAVKFLFAILSKYGAEEQRSFLQFITGSPKLPVGGFKSLNPPLTIVRKTVDSTSNPDCYLPSVMTCVNYLKLPDYSSVDIMSEKLRTAYMEGKNAFHLS